MAQPTIDSIKAVSARLVFSLVVLIALLGILFAIMRGTGVVATLPVVLIFGALGAFVSLQRRLKSLTEEDLLLIRRSVPYTWLAPLTGALLAGILYLLFIAGLLKGALFPTIVVDAEAVKKAVGLAKLFEIEGDGPGEYAKLLFWSFVAGFSERFVTDIIGRFESKAAKENKEAKQD